jgi:hypothetical protein
MHRGFQGLTAPGEILRVVHEHAAGIAQDRLKTFGASVYLVLEARGELTSTPTDVTRDFGEAMLAHDAVDKKELKARFAQLVGLALASVALRINTTADMQKVIDGVAFTLPDGRPLYSTTLTFGNVSLITARPATENDARAIEKTMASLVSEARLATPSRLLIDALRSSSDRLEGFIFAWAGLEMVIRKFTAGCESGEWVSSVPEAYRTAADALHREFVDQKHQFYSLAQRARAFGLRQGLDSGDELAAEVTRLKKAYREPMYHEGAIAERLPVEAVTALLRQVIDAAAGAD